jgi:hypothetical protein
MPDPAGGYEFQHSIVFTGHMIDAPGRKVERFPARAEAAATAAIRRAVEELLGGEPGNTTVGIAGGASGGDLIFHEVCGALGVPTLLRMALPVEEFVKASVAPAGEGWVTRFYALIDRLVPGAVRVLDESVVLPEPLTGGAELNVWQKTNLWMVDEALALAPKRTLLALWDGAAGDGPGGTESMVAAAPLFGMEVAPVISTRGLFNPGLSP